MPFFSFTASAAIADVHRLSPKIPVHPFALSFPFSIFVHVLLNLLSKGGALIIRAEIIPLGPDPGNAGEGK